MMGIRKVGGAEKEVEFGRLVKGEGGRSVSSGSSSSGNVYGLGESEFVSVWGEKGDEL